MAEALRTGNFAAAEERTKARTRQYAKRQRTWFARDAGDPLAWPIDSPVLAATAQRFFSR
jgi:tRNA A37 N6-isopentenylltransferase MiaA